MRRRRPRQKKKSKKKRAAVRTTVKPAPAGREICGFRRIFFVFPLSGWKDNVRGDLDNLKILVFRIALGVREKFLKSQSFKETVFFFYRIVIEDFSSVFHGS